MTKTFSTALAVLLLAGASGAALAQDREQGERGQAQPQQHSQPQQHPQPQQQRAGPPQENRQGGGGRTGGPPHMEGGARGPGGGGGGGGGERAAPAPGGSNRDFQGRDRGPQQGSGGAPRQPDNRGGPHGSPGAGGHADARTNGFFGSRAAPQHWQAGRFPPVFQAQQRFHYGSYRAPPGYYYRAWGFGQILPRPWFAQNYWLANFLDFGLPYPPPGYQWVRVGPDAIMVERYSGRVVQVVNGIFW